MNKNDFGKMINDQLSICNDVYNSSDDYEKYTKTFMLKNNTWIDFDYMYPMEYGSCWSITIIFDDGSYTHRRMFCVNVYVFDDGSNDLDIDSLYERYKRISR